MRGVHMSTLAKSILMVGWLKVAASTIVKLPADETLHDYLSLDPEKQYMDFSNLEINNLAGVGPDTTEAPVLKYKNAYQLPDGVNVDLIVEAVDASNYKVSNPDVTNAPRGKLASIGMRGSRSLTAKFKFVDSATQEPVTMRHVLWTYYDLDGDRKGLLEEIRVPFFEKAYLAENTTINVIYPPDGSPPVFQSTSIDFTGDTNPDDPETLTEDQKRRAVTFSMFSVSEWIVQLSTPNGGKKSGRRFFFSGFPLYADCVNASESTDIQFSEMAYSNLGGKGPNIDAPFENMRFKDVFEFGDGTRVDMILDEVKEDGYKYIPKKPKQNRIERKLASLNMRSRSKAKFLIKFVDAVTDESVTLPNLMFSFLDMDHWPTDPEMRETIIIGGFDKAFVAQNTSIDISDLPGNLTMFKSMEVGGNGGADNPTDPAVLTPVQQRKTFTLYWEAVSEFTFIVDLTPSNKKRNRRIYMGGISRLNNAEEETLFCTPAK